MSRFGNSGTLRRSDVVQVFGLVAVDVFALYEAFVLAYIVRSNETKPLAHYVSPYGFGLMVAMVAPLWILVFAVCGLYSLRLHQRRMSEVTRVVVAVAGGVMSLIVWDYLRPQAPLFPSRSVPVWAVLFGVVLVLSCRFLLRRAIHACFARGLGLHNVIVIGSGPLAATIAEEMARPGQGYRIAAAVDASRDGGELPSEMPVPIFRSLEAAVEAVKARGWKVDEIMQAELDLARTEIAQMMAYANREGISYRFVPDQFGVYAAASSASTVGGIPVLELRLTALDGWGAVGKRAFDLLGSAIALLLLSPVLLAVAAAVKLSDRDGPVFYRQERLGKNGRSIQVLKFRSMTWRYSTGPDREFHTAPEAFLAMSRPDLISEFELTHKVADDPRISKVGQFLRRSSLDELPQLLNALLGELSLVGPRPITLTELDRYGDQRASFLALKPGITGLWQVSGRSQISYNDRVKMDVFYVENWSLGLDVSILFRTVRSVTARKGAC
jgi:exopolysaccharide biosynthesis polyprenyl glycosylphosphotransferase